jgi:hypothetical protein
MTAEIPATGGWAAKKTVSLGRVKVAATGEITVLAKPADPSAWNAINLWQIELTSVE